MFLVSVPNIPETLVEKRFHRAAVGDALSLFTSLQTAAEAQHASLIEVVDVALYQGTVRCWMEYVPGDSLANIAAQGVKRGEIVPLPIAVRIIADAAQGLHGAHELGRSTAREPMFVHGALSARGILVGLSGEVKVLELGAGGVVLRAEQNANIPLHLAPELTQGRGYDRRVDIFALGVILRELVAASRPPMPLLEVIARATSMHPETRQTSADELARAICAVIAPAAREEVAAWIEEPSSSDQTVTKKALRIVPEQTGSLDRSFDNSQSTDPSKPNLQLSYGTSTQDGVDLTHTVSREQSQSDPGEVLAREKRAVRRGKLKSKRNRRRLVWALVLACLPMFLGLGWFARRRFVHQRSVRGAVLVEGRAFGSEQRFDRPESIALLREEPLLFWGKAELPQPIATKKSVRPKLREPRVVEKVEPVKAVAPKVVETVQVAPKNTGRVSVRVMRDGSSSRMLVYVDGKPALQSPSEVELSPGPHSFEVRPKGRPAVKKTVEVRLGDNNEVLLDAGEDF